MEDYQVIFTPVARGVRAGLYRPLRVRVPCSSSGGNGVWDVALAELPLNVCVFLLVFTAVFLAICAIRALFAAQEVILLNGGLGNHARVQGHFSNRLAIADRHASIREHVALDESTSSVRTLSSDTTESTPSSVDFDESEMSTSPEEETQ